MALPNPLYTTLNNVDHQIRVIDLLPSKNSDSHLECHLRIVSLDQDHEYDALSWCWGTGPHSGTLLVDSQTFECSINLELALRHFRDTAVTKTLWVDAICINQADLDEKSHQIVLMGRVYSQAQTVRAWLGESTEDSDQAVNVMRHFQRSRGFRQVEINGSPVSAPQIQSFIKLLQRPWWTRIWVVQEVLLARNAILYCGSASFELGFLHLILTDAMTEKAARVASIMSGSLVLGLNDAEQELEDALFEALRTAITPFGQVTHIVQSVRIGRGRQPIDTVKTMLALGNLRATDLRDKVYGCMGIFPELAKLMPVNYKTPVAIVYAVATYCLARYHLQTLHPLCYFQALTLPSLPGLPSWSLKFDRGAEVNVELPRQFRTFAAEGWKEWTPPELQILPNTLAIRLSLSASCLDEIVSCHPTLQDWTAYYDTYNQVARQPGFQCDADSRLHFAHHSSCHRTWRSYFDLSVDGASHGAYVGGGSMEEAYWRTVAFNSRCSKAKALKRLGNSDVKSYLRMLQREANQEDHSRAAQGAHMREREDHTLAEEYPFAVIEATARDYGPIIRGEPPFGANLFKTKRGYIGLTLHEVAPGDHVYVLDRATLPMVLRAQRTETGETIFQVKSACYVHGVMYGQAFHPLPDTSSKPWRRHELRRKVFGGHALDAGLPLKKWDRITLV